MKQNDKDAGFKNPLSMAFGIFLKELREVLGVATSEEFAKDFLGLGSAYYRTVESGNSHLSPYHVLKILESIQRSNIKNLKPSFENMVLYLSVNAYLESLVRSCDPNTSERYHLCAQQLLNGMNTGWLSTLLNRFVEIGLFNSNADTKKILYENNIDRLLFSFFTRGDGFALYQECVGDLSEAMCNVVINKVNTLPSVYLPISVIGFKQISLLSNTYSLEEVAYWVSHYSRDLQSWHWLKRDRAGAWRKERNGFHLEKFSDELFQESLSEALFDSLLILVTDDAIPVVFYLREGSTSWKNLSCDAARELSIPVNLLHT